MEPQSPALCINGEINLVISTVRPRNDNYSEVRAVGNHGTEGLRPAFPNPHGFSVVKNSWADTACILLCPFLAARGPELFAASGPQLAGAAGCMYSCSKYCVRDFTKHRQSLSPRTVGLKETSGDLVHFSSEEVLDILRSSLTSVQIFKSSSTEPSTYLPSLEFVGFFFLYT